MSERKTHAELIAEMRNIGNTPRNYTRPDGYGDYETVTVKRDEWLIKHLDSLEEAHKREMDEAERRGNHAAMKVVGETIAKVGPLYDAEAVGNAAKLREAAKAVVDVGYPHNFQKEAPHIRGYCYDITKAIEKCFNALAAPPRNCDVGTADEQRRRYDEWRNYDGLRAAFGKDELDWAQLPYESENAAITQQLKTQNRERTQAMKKSIDIKVEPCRRTAIERLCDQIMSPEPSDPIVKHLAPLSRDERRDLCDRITYVAMLDVHAVRQEAQDDMASLAESVARLTRMLEEATRPIQLAENTPLINIDHVMPLGKEEK